MLNRFYVSGCFDTFHTSSLENVCVCCLVVFYVTQVAMQMQDYTRVIRLWSSEAYLSEAVDAGGYVGVVKLL